MARKNNKGTTNIPLKMTKVLTEIVNETWENGTFLEKVTPTTQMLLRYWFSDSFCQIRELNFHEGQKQAILNIIYLYEVLKVKNVKDIYHSVAQELLDKIDRDNLDDDKYQHPMYCVKMATGTGKTWVLDSLIIWQYLNARENEKDFSKNFLLVAPGLIVYNRLLDSFLGKEDIDGSRNFATSDFYFARELFIPEMYREIIYSFIQSSVVKKEEISSKITGDGIIAITNWHALVIDDNENEVNDPLEDIDKIYDNVLPISPGTTQGNSLEQLDNNFLKGDNIEFLSNLNNLMVFNDEAHHIHEVKKGGEVFEVEWQKSLNKISDGKNLFVQVDFSATPYNSSSGKNKIKHYFPHIIVDFDLRNAIHNGLVKMIAIDKRKEFNSIPLDYKAERDGNKVIGLSKGQKLMLRAGLTKLKNLNDEFLSIDPEKHPKMLVVCEDTNVTPFVHEFLTMEEGLTEEDVLEIHSNKKNELPEKEWDKVKQRLFNMDKLESPKVIISVLMLREGFDVNNICVIVPLRSTESSILLEQTVGRGLRLMWREPDYDDIKFETRRNILEKKKEPSNYLDILSIVEHPNFSDFYEEYIVEGMVTDITDVTNIRILGDMVVVGLKDNYEEYDFYWPQIIRDSEEIIKPDLISLDSLEPIDLDLNELKSRGINKDEEFTSKELTVGTKFGRYSVSTDIFSAESYNELLAKIMSKITSMIQKVGRKQKSFPIIQVNRAEVTELMDEYIRTRLFNQKFNPMENNNWKILLYAEDRIINHIIKQISNKVLYDMHINVDVTEAEIEKKYFSDIKELKMRENYSIEVTKTIYTHLNYPSNGGGLEKEFILACDNDSEVTSFIKINEYYHTFMSISYIRDDGLLARYYPDFLVKIKDNIYVVETKADKDITTENVQSKKISTVNEIEKINQLKSEDRMNSQWYYCLLPEKSFKSMNEQGASIKEILDYAIITQEKARGFKTLDELF